MKKTKIKQRIENAVNAFFDDDQQQSGDNGLSFVSDASLLKQETASRFNEKGDVLVKILKRAFVFLPGVFYLFFGTLTVFTFEFLRSPGSILAIFLIGSFMTIFGIGNLKNPKHLVIPLSIIAVATFVVSLFSMFESLRYVFEYGIYFFPLALILPFLARDLADRTGKEKDSRLTS